MIDAINCVKYIFFLESQILILAFELRTVEYAYQNEHFVSRRSWKRFFLTFLS